MKVKKRWITLMTAMTIIAIAGLAVGEPSFECDWSVISAADVAWLITATIFVLMMTPGLSFFYGGMVGAKNVISTMLQSFIAMGLISVLWVVIGFSLCFGDDIGGVIGNPLTFPMFHGVGGAVYTTPAGNVLGGATIPLALFALFQMKFAIRARQVLSLYVLHDVLLLYYILSAGTHDMAPRGFVHEVGRHRLCRWYRRPRIIRYRSSGRCHLPRTTEG